MLFTSIFNTSEILYQLNVKHVVLSSGSRNAPLVISFARNEKLKKWIIPDERSAGFIAVGIAQKTQSPVALCCTSGTALLNYYPAVTEAFYREIPLIVLSADRPKELIDKREGQTIRQYQVLKNHIKKSYQLPITENTKDETDYISKLITGGQLSQSLPKGPVHFNIPFKEPFYPKKEQKLNFQKYEIPPIFQKTQAHKEIKISIKKNSKILIVIGQQNPDTSLNKQLDQLTHIPIIQSPLSNLSQKGIEHVELFLNNQKELQPDILITTGLSILSKKLKQFLKNNPPKKHIHIDPAQVKADTFNTNPKIIGEQLSDFLKNINLKNTNKIYIQRWQLYSQKTKKSLSNFIKKSSFCETTAFYTLLKKIPQNIDLHLSNSMPIRFVDMFGVNKNTITWCNRGTSGIDGCTSTAVGTSWVSHRLNVLLTGDISFFYDRNAFFHQHHLSNLRIIISNNHGGGIFRLIEGPSNLPELATYFETQHNRTAKYICMENNMDYQTAYNEKELIEKLKGFFIPDNQPKVLEIFTQPLINQKNYLNLKKYIYEQVNLSMENH